MKKALIVQGGWDGHEPVQIADYFKGILENEGFEVEISGSLEAFEDAEALKGLHLIIPVWTMGTMTKEQATNVSEAVARGVGLVGCHGGMCDAFRENVLWQFMTGGNWVSHPGGDGVEYTVEIKNSSSPLVAGMKDFSVKSEHYYLHVDPVVEVLATTKFPAVRWYHSANGEVQMPVCWTKKWGYGRVYYTSLGHHADIVQMTEVTELLKRGFIWAAEGKDLFIQNDSDITVYSNDGSMY